MPSLSKHQSNEYTKLLIEGDSSSGKTGALASLVGAGYKLRIQDYDNGLEPLKQYVRRDFPDKIDNVEYVTLRDKYKAGPEGPMVVKADAFVRGVKLLDHWKYKDETTGQDVDFGVPATWGPDCILVIDSFTFMSDAAFNFREPLAPRGSNGKYDMRAVYKDAQDAVEGVLALLTSEAFRTNVIVITHIRYVDNPDGTRRGYPTAVGSALSPVIPRYFNSVALCQTSGKGVRTIRTATTGMIDLKNPRPFAMADSYPIEIGLAEFFKVLRDQTKEQPTPEPTPKKPIPLKRA